MAYLRNQDDDEEDQKTAPGAFGGGSFVPGSNQGAFAQGGQPQASPQQKQGSGFTNFSDWLNAGKGREQALSSGGGSALGAAKASFGSVADPAEARLANAAPAETLSSDDVTKLTGQASRGEGKGEILGGSWVNDPLGPQTAQDHLVNSINQGFSGPKTIDWDPTQDASTKKLDALSGVDTAGAQLAGETPYSGGARNLDNALYQGDAASRSALDANKASANQFLTDTSAQQASYKGGASALSTAYDTANTANKGAMQGLFDMIKGNVDKQVGNAQSTETGLAGQQGHTGNTAEWAPGSAINEGNTISSDEAGWMNTLGGILGKTPIQKTGDFTRGTPNETPIVAPPPPSSNWQAADQAAQNGAPVGEQGGQQSIIKPGQVSYYVDDAGDYVDKASGKVRATAAQIKQMSDALASGEVQASGGLDGWLKAHNMQNPFGG